MKVPAPLRQPTTTGEITTWGNEIIHELNRFFTFVKSSGWENDLLVITAGTITPRSLAQRFTNVADIRDGYGGVPAAKGNGSNDDWASIIAAIDAIGDSGGGAVSIPPVDVANGKYWRVAGKPLTMRDNVILMGQGYASQIRNDDTSGIVINEYCVLFGFAHPTHVEDTYTKYTIADTAIGDDIVTIDTGSEAGNFTVGGLIVIMDGKNYTLSGKPLYHNYLMTRVTSVDTGTGVVGLEHAMADAYTTSGVVSPQVYDPNEASITFDHGFAAFGTSRGGLMNLSLISDNGAPTARGGMLECVFQNLWTEGTMGFCFGNLFAHCAFENIWSQVTDRGMEIKMGSHDSKFRNIHATYHSGGTPGAPIDFGESARDNQLEAININTADQNPAGTNVLFSQCKRNTIHHSRLVLAGETAALVGFDNTTVGSPDDMRCESNEFSYNTVIGVAPARFVKYDSHDADACRRNRCEHNNFFGTPTADAVVIAGEEQFLFDNFFENGALSFAAAAAAGFATKCYISRNTFRAAMINSSRGDEVDLLQNFVWNNVELGTNDPDDSYKSVFSVLADFTIPEHGDGMGFTNEGASGTVTVTLPVARRGKRFSAHRIAAQSFRFDPNGTEQIRLNDGTLGTAGFYVQLGADDDYIELVCYDTGIWFLTTQVGTIALQV